MTNFCLITDSCSDLAKGVRQKYGIEYVKMNITYGDKELPASLDWDLYSPKELYDIMRGGTRIMTTQVPTQEFMTTFESALKAGQDVVYIGCSSALSGSVNTGVVVANELMEKYPNKVYVVDSLCSCMGEGLMVIDAAKMREEGKSAAEVAAYFEENKLRYLQFCAVENLTYLKRAGRVKASTAFFGKMFGIKPILISNKAGENFAVKKVKGRKPSLDEIFNMAREAARDVKNQEIALVHADCAADAEYLKGRIEKELQPKALYVNYIGPIIGASAGPGTIAIYLRGEKVDV